MANTKNPGAVYVVWGGEALTGGSTVDLAEAAYGGSTAALLLAVGGAGESLGDTVRLADFNHDGRADVRRTGPAHGLIENGLEPSRRSGEVSDMCHWQTHRARRRTAPVGPTPRACSPS